VKVTVIGTGYLGVVHAVTLCELGHEVLAMDVNKQKIDLLAKGHATFHEPDLPKLLLQHVTSGQLKFTTSFRDVARFAHAHFLCVGTPVLDSGHVDLHYLFDAVEKVAPHFEGGTEHLFIGKSTVPPGTAKGLLEAANKVIAETGVIVDVAWNPEFLREGSALFDSMWPSRLVLGTNFPRALMTLEEIYEKQIHGSGLSAVRTDVPTAEVCKLVSNAFLAAKISFINGVDEYCKKVGADISMVSWAMGADPRIGRQGMKAGLGFGGGCLPKDLAMLTNSCEDMDAYSFGKMLRIVNAINFHRRDSVVGMVRNILEVRNLDFRGKKIGILGLAFKPGTDDMRDSPGLWLAHEFAEFGAHVLAHDPVAVHPDFSTEIGNVLECDVVIVATDHYGYGKLDPSLFSPSKIIDARYILDRKKWEAAGWKFYEVGE
jgi:UDPglucose 6-dehydrogenase